MVYANEAFYRQEVEKLRSILYGGKEMVNEKVRGTITRKSKAGLQLDNVNKWYNRGFKYQGESFDTLDVGNSVEFEANDKGFIGTLSVVGQGSNGHSNEEALSNPTPTGPSDSVVSSPTSEFVQRSAIVSSVIKPSMAGLLSLTRTQKEAFNLVTQIATVVEGYVTGKYASLAASLAAMVPTEKNGSSKK